VIELPHIWVPPRRGLIVPSRDIELLPLPKIEAAVAIVQYAQNSGPGSNPGPIATLGATPTPGNIIFCQYAGSSNVSPAQTSGNAFTRIGTVVQAHATFGSYVNTYYRRVQAGDGTSYGFDNIGWSAITVIEVSGLDPTGVPGNVANSSSNASATIAAAMGGTAALWALVSVVTRLLSGPPPAGTVTPNGASTAAAPLLYGPSGHEASPIFLHGAGNATIGGTQANQTADGFNYGYTAFTWSPRRGKVSVRGMIG
jgi:hypothetical protein